jgi:hypothetical protein
MLSLEAVSDFQRLLAAEVAGRDHLVAAAELVAIVDVGGGPRRVFPPD